MSLEASRWAWEQRDLPPTAKLVLLALAECVNGRDDADTCYPGQGRLAMLCGVSERQVRNLIRELERLGLVETIRRPGDGAGRKSNIYRLAIGDRNPAGGGGQPDTGNRKPVSPCLEEDEGQPETGFRNSVADCLESNRKSVSSCPEATGNGLPELDFRLGVGNRKPISAEPEELLREKKKNPPVIPPETGSGPRPDAVGMTPPETPADPVKDREAEPASGAGSRKALVIDLPDWLDGGTWSEFLEHRRKLKAPMTDLAQRRAVRELGRLREAGHDPETVLDQSIVNGWKGLFPVKGMGARAGPGPSFEQQRIGATVSNLRNLFGDHGHGTTDFSTDDDLPRGSVFDGDFQRESGRVLGSPQRNAR